MRQIILIILLFFTIVNITYAIPIPALVVGWGFVLFLIPAVLSLFSAIYFYFNKYIFWLNIYLLICGGFLYYYHYYLTKELFLFNYEYLIFWMILIVLWLVYKFKKLSFIKYLLVISLLWINFFLIKIDYNLYEFKKIANKVEKDIYSNIKITNILYKDNFVVFYIFDKELQKKSYSVVWKWKQVKHCYKIKKFHICNSWDKWLSELFSSLLYKSIK
jgi:hypothetical protein